MQRALVVAAVLLAILWCSAWWPAHPWLAVVGAVLLLFGYALVLALELVLLATAGHEPATPRPRLPQLLAAWGAEVAHDLRVFAWRQPFAWRRVADHLPTEAAGRPGVVFVHGFVCNRGFWTPWLQQARQRGVPFVAVNLEPVFGSIDDYAGTIEQAVVRVTAATGRAPVLVCHSMGGLAARAWSRRHAGTARVAHVVTIGTPHHGTWLARFSRLPNGRQMQVGGDWLDELHRDGVPAPGTFTCWYSNCDNVVFPPSTATLAQADNRLVQGVAHVQLAFHPRVMRETWDLLQQP